MSREDFGSAILKLHEAAIDPALWPTALQAIEELTNCGVVLQFNPKTTACPGITMAGQFSEEQCETYGREFLPICPRVAFAIQRPDLRIVYDSMLGMSEAELNRDPVYDWFRQNGLRYFIAANLGETDDYHLLTSLQRTPGQGHVQRQDIELYEQLVPHISLAVRTAQVIGSLKSHWRFGASMLDSMPQAVYGVGRQGRVVFANATGEALLRSNDGLSLKGGVLMAARADDSRRLQQLIGQAITAATDGSNGPAGGWLRIPRPSGRLPFAVLISPVISQALHEICRNEGLIAAQGPSAMVIIHDQEIRRNFDEKVLRTLYGLTPTEARIAVLVSRGLNTDDVASQFGIAVATVRVHLRSIYRKLGIKDRGELIALATILSGGSSV